MFEQRQDMAGGTPTTVDDPPDDDVVDFEDLDEAAAAEVRRAAQARLDRMFPRTGPARSAWRLRKAQFDAQARRAAKKVVTEHRLSAWSAAMPQPGLVRSAGELPGMAPGPALAAALSDLDVVRLPAHDLVHVVTATERLASWVASVQAEAISVLSSDPLYDVDPLPGRPVRNVPLGVDQTDVERMEAWKGELECVRATGAEIGAALRLSRGAAEARVRNAQALTRRHPATLAALRDGEIDAGRAKAIIEELDPDTTGLSTSEARTVEDAVLHKARTLTAARLRSLTQRERIRIAPSSAEREHERARDGRRVEFRPAEAGMGWLNAHLTADAMAALRAALDAAANTLKAADQRAAREHAQANPDQDHCNGPVVRTIAQCRADALSQMAWLALDTGHLGGCPEGTKLANARGDRPRIHVTVPVSTLLGLDEHPGDLTGYGPIPASIARAIAARGTWYRILTDPRSGTVLDVGTTRYEPPDDLARHVQIRDRICRGPGCGQPAHRTDLDHTIEHPVGPTAAHNLGPLCRNDHLTKHRRGWRLTQPRPGVFEWTSPAGHTYDIAPEQVGPILDELKKLDEPDASGTDPPEGTNPLDVAEPRAGPAWWLNEDAIPPF